MGRHPRRPGHPGDRRRRQSARRVRDRGAGHGDRTGPRHRLGAPRPGRSRVLPRAADPGVHRPGRPRDPRPHLSAAQPLPQRARRRTAPVRRLGARRAHQPLPLVLDLEIAYFTSRGIGVAEVNYGGSTGYGRAYRERLREQWGVVDVEDCAAVARSLADEGTADPARLAIRGGSAGGWTSAASLTGTDLYACVTISYPILDLSTWATDGTHDFESRYLESLVGPFADVPGRYRERSPINHVDKITAPFLLLQGLDDVICPPVQCERFLDQLAGRGIPHAYIAFEGEGHGFRRADTMVRALEAELSLYAQTFGISRPDVPRLELNT